MIWISNQIEWIKLYIHLKTNFLCRCFHIYGGWCRAGAWGEEISTSSFASRTGIEEQSQILIPFSFSSTFWQLESYDFRS